MKKVAKQTTKKRVEFDFNKFLGRIRELHITQAEIAEQLGISKSTLNLKINNKGGQFSQEELFKMLEIAKIPDDEIKTYFFTPIV